MTGIGGPGGVGPKGPTSASPDLAEPGDVSGAASDRTAGATTTQGATAAQRGEAAGQAQRSAAATGLRGMDALAGELASGRLTPQQAIDYLVEAAGAQLDATERAELREMLGDLLANDPHLRSLIDNLSGGR
jgi:hypothetical protein